MTRKKRHTVSGYFDEPSECFTFSGDAGGRLRGGCRVFISGGPSAPGCGSGDQRGGEGVDVCGVGDVAQLVFSLGENDAACVKQS